MTSSMSTQMRLRGVIRFYYLVRSGEEGLQGRRSEVPSSGTSSRRANHREHRGRERTQRQKCRLVSSREAETTFGPRSEREKLSIQGMTGGVVDMRRNRVGAVMLALLCLPIWGQNA